MLTIAQWQYRDEIEKKAIRIAEYAGIADIGALKNTMARVWHLEDLSELSTFAVI